MTRLQASLTGLQTVIELSIDTDLRGFGHIRERPTQRPSESLPAASLCALQRRPRNLYTEVHNDVQAR